VKKEKEKKHTHVHITQKVKIYSEIQTQNHITTVAQVVEEEGKGKIPRLLIKPVWKIFNRLSTYSVNIK